MQDVESSQLPYTAVVSSNCNCYGVAMYILSRTKGFVDAGEELAEDVVVRQIAKMVRCWWMARWSIDINVIGYRTDIISVRAIGALVRRYCGRQLA